MWAEVNWNHSLWTEPVKRTQHWNHSLWTEPVRRTQCWEDMAPDLQSGAGVALQRVGKQTLMQWGRMWGQIALTWPCDSDRTHRQNCQRDTGWSIIVMRGSEQIITCLINSTARNIHSAFSSHLERNTHTHTHTHAHAHAHARTHSHKHTLQQNLYTLNMNSEAHCLSDGQTFRKRYTGSENGTPFKCVQPGITKMHDKESIESFMFIPATTIRFIRASSCRVSIINLFICGVILECMAQSTCRHHCGRQRKFVF